MSDNGNGSDIRLKIKKLFQLSNSPNENEAALALERAQKLMEEYNLTMSEVEGVKDAGSNDIIDEKYNEKAKRFKKWETVLFGGVCESQWEFFPDCLTNEGIKQSASSRP